MKKIILLALVSFTVGCGVQISPTQLKKAEEICSDKGGIYYLRTEDIFLINTLNVRCYDDTYESLYN